MDAKNPASNNVPTPTDEEDLELVEYEDIYCENKSKTINNMVNDDPPPPFKTVADVQLDTLETLGQLHGGLRMGPWRKPSYAIGIPPNLRIG